MTEDQVFDGERLVLDGEQYINCTFTGCALVYSGGVLPMMQYCKFDGCGFVLEESALRTMTFLAELVSGSDKGRDIVETLFMSILAGKVPGIADIQAPTTFRGLLN